LTAERSGRKGLFDYVVRQEDEANKKVDNEFSIRREI